MRGTIFERYGGFASVSRIVSAFYNRVLDDPHLSPYFAAVEMRSLIDHQIKMLATLMGGPASFNNEHLARVHSRLGIDEATFDLMSQTLRETLEDFDMDESDIATVYGAFVGRKSFIVTHTESIASEPV